MKLSTIIRINLITLAVILTGTNRAQESGSLDFKEIYDLLRNNMVGMSETELNREAARGLLNQLQPKVTLISPQAQTQEESKLGPMLRSTVFEGAYAYLRVGQIKAGAEQEMMTAFNSLASSNKIKGLVLDLRFAAGDDYEAAAAMADWFFSTEQPLIDYGAGMKKSTVKKNACRLPLALLVNHKTAGAAEALVGILRQADIGLTIGSTTAGEATIFKEFTLKTGQRLRVAMASIKVGNEKALPLTGLRPDIRVEVNPVDEALYLQDPYKDLNKASRLAKAGSLGGTNQVSASTNRMPRHRINEAELVRMLQEGESFDMESNITGRAEVARPTVQDPALSRALDLLKGLSVLRQFRTL